MIWLNDERDWIVSVKNRPKSRVARRCNPKRRPANAANMYVYYISECVLNDSSTPSGGGPLFSSLSTSSSSSYEAYILIVSFEGISCQSGSWLLHWDALSPPYPASAHLIFWYFRTEHIAMEMSKTFPIGRASWHYSDVAAYTLFVSQWRRRQPSLTLPSQMHQQNAPTKTRRYVETKQQQITKMNIKCCPLEYSVREREITVYCLSAGNALCIDFPIRIYFQRLSFAFHFNFIIKVDAAA